MKARLSVGTVFLSLFFGLIAWGLTLPSVDYTPVEVRATERLEAEAYAERLYRAALTPAMAELVLSPAEIAATYRWKGPLSSGETKLPDSLHIVGVGEVGRHSLNTSWHAWRMENDPFYIEWMQSVDDTMGVAHDLRGWGVRTLDAAQDSIIRGGDGIAGNGDEWSSTITIISDTTEFRECAANASDKSLDICTFDAGGIYDLEGAFHPAGDYIYLAAHANPGGGVTSESGRWRWTNNASDVFIRGLRLATPGGNHILNENVSNVVLYEVTGRYGANSGGHGNLLGWSPETDAGETANYLTIQRSLCHSSDIDHPTCASFGAFSSRSDPSHHISIHETVFSGYQHRTVMCNSQEVQQTYSVVYNWDSRGLETNNDYSCDFWGGYHKVGPGTNTTTYDGEAVTPADSNCDLGSDPNNGDNDCSGALYVSKMRVSNTATPYDSTISQDEMRTGDINAANKVLGCRVASGLWCDADGDTLPTIDNALNGSTGSGTWDFVFSSTRVTSDVEPSWAQPDEGAMSDALFQELVGVSGEAIGSSGNGAVGAYRSLNEDGSWRRTMDAPDTLALFQVLDSTGDTGFLDRNSETNPVPSAGTPYTDADGDGMPATWEAANGLDDSDASDRDEDPDGDGRINIVEYLDGLDPNTSEDETGVASGGGGGALTYNTTWFDDSDTSFSAYVLRLVIDTFIWNGGADSTFRRRPHRDTVPLGSIYVFYEDCTSGDTIGIVVTQDTLAVGVDTLTAMTASAIDDSASAWGADCTSTILRGRKVHGALN